MTVFRLDHLELAVDGALNSGGLAAKAPEPAKPVHPRLDVSARPRAAARQFLLQGLGHVLPKGLAAFSGSGFRTPEQRIRNLDGGLHVTIFPYLRSLAMATAHRAPYNPNCRR
jgi:hypothetical protein